MKIGFVLSLIFGLHQIVSAQVTDTLGYANFLEGTPALYESPNGGYAFGTNGYNDVAKAQTYTHSSPFVLKQVLMEFGEAIFLSEDSTSSIRVNLYDNNGFGVTSAGQADSIAPDSILAFVEIPVYDLQDDGTLTTADFSATSLPVFTRFSVGVDFSNVATGDTVGLASTTDGDAIGSFNAWELTQTGNWVTVEQPSYSWGLEVDFAIFPVIDENDPASTNNLREQYFSLYPNPCVNEVRLISSLQEKEYTLSVFDVTGQEIYTPSTQQTNGVLDVAGLKPGVYFLSISIEGSTVSKRFVKL